MRRVESERPVNRGWVDREGMCAPSTRTIRQPQGACSPPTPLPSPLPPLCPPNEAVSTTGQISRVLFNYKNSPECSIVVCYRAGSSFVCPKRTYSVGRVVRASPFARADNRLDSGLVRVEEVVSRREHISFLSASSTDI